MKKIIILFLIILFFTKTQNLFGRTNTFAVDNVEVSGTIKDKNNRNNYLQTAFRISFQKLVTGIVRKQNQKELLSTDLNTIKSLISNYKIIEEEYLNDKYHLKTEVRFDRKSVERFLQKRNISYAEIKKLEIMIYPILIINSELEVLSKNKFFNEWNEEIVFENINFILPIDNLDDIDFIKSNLEILEETNLSKLVNNYEVKNNAILIIRFNKNKLSAFLKTNLEGVKKAKKIDFNIENIENKNVRKEIILNLKNYINELWKEENLIDISAPSYITLNTALDKNETLKNLIEKIKKVTLIESYTINTVDNQSLNIKIKFFGKIKNLQDRFEEIGFKLELINEQWNLT
tara:strand:+ start:1581 stop:2621 length:1041 start_codon:yes stop_codon:yes gene_type:complete